MGDLSRLDPTERRSRLRAFQLELPPERRAHAQPLFHQVQREWEQNEAVLRSRASSQLATEAKESADVMDAAAGEAVFRARTYRQAPHRSSRDVLNMRPL